MIKIRTTELMQFRDCALKYEKQFGEGGKIQPPTQSMIDGTRNHEEIYEHLLNDRWEHIPEKLHFIKYYFDIKQSNIELADELLFDLSGDGNQDFALVIHADLVTIRPGEVLVLDFKTNAVPEDDFQLKTYCLVLARRHGLNNAHAWFASIKLGYYKAYHYDAKELLQHEYNIRFLLERLLYYRKKGERPASLGTWCNSCNFASECMLRAQAAAPGGFDSIEAAAEFIHLYDAAEKQYKEAREIIKKHMLDNGISELNINGKKRSVTTTFTLR